MKAAKLPIKSTAKGWTFSVPSHLSPTGKRHRPFFETKAKAQAARQVYVNAQRMFGASGSLLTPSQTEDAQQALALIAGKGMTLTGVVQQWLTKQASSAQSWTVQAVLDKVIAIKSGAEPSPLAGASRNPKPLRETTLRGMRKIFDRSIKVLGTASSADLTTAKVVEILGKAFRSDAEFDLAVRYLRAAYNIAVEAGWSPENPFSGIKQSHRKSDAVDILQTAAQVQAVIEACRDLRRDKLPRYARVDATDALAGFVILIFAGARPAELQRLTWSDVSFEHGHIRISGEASKTHTLRHITMSDNLIAWLKPLARSPQDAVCCPGWGNKYKAVRLVAGLNKRAGDILRHTFASAHLASGGSMDDLLNQMGHTTSKVTLKHYVGGMAPHEARQFWRIGPEGWTPFKTVKKTEAASA